MPIAGLSDSYLCQEAYKNHAGENMLLPDKCPRISIGCDIQKGSECESMQEYVYCEHFHDGRWRKEVRIIMTSGN